MTVTTYIFDVFRLQRVDLFLSSGKKGRKSALSWVPLNKTVHVTGPAASFCGLSTAQFLPGELLNEFSSLQTDTFLCALFGSASASVCFSASICTSVFKHVMTFMEETKCQ